MVDVILVDMPSTQIKRAVENEDWVSAYATAVSYFEYYGAEIIKRRFESTDISGLESRVERLGVSAIVLLLRLLDVTNGDLDSKMVKIIKERNALIHLARKGVGYTVVNREEREAELLGDARECLDALFGILNSM